MNSRFLLCAMGATCLASAVDGRVMVRANRDTLYSVAVFDLDAGPVTVTLPDSGKRFMSLQAIDQDQYSPIVAHGAGRHTFKREQFGTRFITVGIRTLVDPASERDFAQAHYLQDEVRVSKNTPGKFESPHWDNPSRKRVREALGKLAENIFDSRRMFGTRDQVDPVRHLIGTATGWGGNPEKAALYFQNAVTNNDGSGVYRLKVPKNVPVDAFWSLTLYDAEGYFEKNQYDAYSLNSITAKRSGDGSVAVQFGGCDGNIPNCLPIMKGWNYTVRFYRPRAEILSGQWKFPEPQAIEDAHD